MRVLNVLPGAATRLGGPPAFVGGSALELAKLNVAVRVMATDLALGPWGWMQLQRRVQLADVHPTLIASDLCLYRAEFPRRFAYSHGLSDALREQVSSFDVVHIHNLWQFPQYSAYRASTRQGVPYVVSPHGGFDPFLRERGRLRKGLTTSLWQADMLKRAALIHVTTEAERDLISDIAPRVPRAVVPCGIFANEFNDLPPRELFRRRRLGGYAGPVILFLGRITEKKGIDVLIQAFAKVRHVHESRLVIVGPDDLNMRPKLAQLANELGVGSDVVLHEPVYGDERLAALSCADVWALSSHAENFGIAVVEAMAASRPVVISRGVNLAPDVELAEAGIVTDATPESFGKALEEVLTDHDRRERLKRNARRFAASYDWSIVAPQLLEMYRIAGNQAGVA